jgi:hypothetical protein
MPSQAHVQNAAQGARTAAQTVRVIPVVARGGRSAFTTGPGRRRGRR